jgi:hypothetical protein
VCTVFDDLPVSPRPHHFFAMIPLEQLDEGEDIACQSCRKEFDEWAYYDWEEHYFCEGCAEALMERWLTEARAYAEANCRITCELPAYDPALEFKCTPQEYEEGDRESYSENAYLCRCRHGCTNYEELIRQLDRDYAEHRVYYTMIRKRIDELLEEHEDYMRYELEDEEEDEELESDRV